MEEQNKNYEFIANATDQELYEFIMNGSDDDVLSVMTYFIEHGSDLAKKEIFKLFFGSFSKFESEILLKSEILDKFIDIFAHTYDSFGELLENRFYTSLTPAKKLYCLFIYRWREDLDLNDSAIAFVDHELDKLTKKLFSLYDYDQITDEIIKLQELPLEDQILQVRSMKFSLERETLIKKMQGRATSKEDENYIIFLTKYLNLLDEQMNINIETSTRRRGDFVFRINLLHQFGIIQFINQVWELNKLKGKREYLISELIGCPGKESTVQPLLSNKDDKRLRSDKMEERIEVYLKDFNLDIDKIKIP